MLNHPEAHQGKDLDSRASDVLFKAAAAVVAARKPCRRGAKPT